MADPKDKLREINREIVSAVIKSKDNKILMGLKSEKTGQVYSGCWAIPGGGIEEGENHISALIREVDEETRIDISKYKIELVDGAKNGISEKTLKDTGERVLCHMHFMDYRVTIDDKNADEIEVNTDREFEESRWFSFEELNQVKLTPPSKELFKKMGFIKE